jgi:murein L,D-transpeptidase YcbB/YkuD
MVQRLLLCFCLFFSSVVVAVEHPVIFSALVNPDSRELSLPFQTYTDLPEAQLFYQRLNLQGHWPVIDKGPLLRLGDRHQQTEVLRHQLFLLGDYPRRTLITRDRKLFDSDLSDALKRFQFRHGAKVDGILGPESRRMLNVSPAVRLGQLQLNQIRNQLFKGQLSGQNGDRYIQVNIPEFRLRLIDGDENLLQMKTIVGRKKRKTPVFITEIKALVLNPSWTVPKSIAYKDIIPDWQQNPDHLSRSKLQVVNGWGNNRQRVPEAEVDPQQMYLGRNYNYFWKAPGADNPLGRIKFMSRSRYAIYLHDTSAPRLFDNPRRDFSSGCIRVERAQDLAQMLLQLDSPEQQSLLEKGLSIDETGEIHLRQPVPVYMTYWTAWVDGKGLLNFRNDIYNRDAWEMSQFLSSAQVEQGILKTAD